ncbi:hypothetical protein [Levilactobacillus fuyuanensis]|uniref:Uncharacterized protein n=1 Tax=Levilactobacillus fuyuanensis TaxID=2486022 RepID=A0ABW4H3S3_9LACO|nr:hypothetical protein [Levilactobacillus fuyuanensis]
MNDEMDLTKRIFKGKYETRLVTAFVYIALSFSVMMVFYGIAAIENWNFEEILVKNIHTSFGVSFVSTGVMMFLLTVFAYVANRNVFSLAHFLIFVFTLGLFAFLTSEMLEVDPIISIDSLVLSAVFALSINVLMIVSALIKILNVLIQNPKDRLTVVVSFFGAIISLIAFFK